MLKYKSYLDGVHRKVLHIDKSKYKWRLDQSERVSSYTDEFFNNFIKTLKDTDFICYPYVKELKKKIAKHDNIDGIHNIFLTPGSDQAIRTMFDLCVEPGSEVLSTNPCFPMYDVYSSLYQAKLTSVEYNENLEWSMSDMIKSITDKTSLVIVANPNNPIGDYKSRDELNELFIYTESKGIPVLVDEAYIQFLPNHYDKEASIREGFKFQNVVTCRTFSKALGGAGARIGYMITNRPFMEKIEKWRMMHEITGCSVKFGSYILDNYSEVQDYINRTNFEKYMLIDKLSEKYDVIGGHCNWIHVNDKDDNNFICSVLDRYPDVTYKAGVSIPHDERTNWLRLTIGPDLQNQKFMKEIIDGKD